MQVRECVNYIFGINRFAINAPLVDGTPCARRQNQSPQRPARAVADCARVLRISRRSGKRPSPPVFLRSINAGMTFLKSGFSDGLFLYKARPVG